jgi:hypothetical protein
MPYQFALDAERGTYLLDRWDSGRLTTLENGSVPVARRGGQPNRIELTCAGATIAVSVNGVRIATVEDGSHQAGLFWIGLESDPARRQGVEARFDNLVVIQR